MLVSFTTDTNPANFKWFLHGQEGCFTHKGHAEQHFDGVVRFPIKAQTEERVGHRQGHHDHSPKFGSCLSGIFQKNG